MWYKNPWYVHHEKRTSQCQLRCVAVNYGASKDQHDYDKCMKSLVEKLSIIKFAKVRVAGSSPVVRSKKVQVTGL